MIYPVSSHLFNYVPKTFDDLRSLYFSSRATDAYIRIISPTMGEDSSGAAAQSAAQSDWLFLVLECYRELQRTPTAKIIEISVSLSVSSELILPEWQPKGKVYSCMSYNPAKVTIPVSVDDLNYEINILGIPMDKLKYL